MQPIRTLPPDCPASTPETVRYRKRIRQRFVGPGSKPVPLTPTEIKALGIALPGSENENKPVVKFDGKVGDQVMILTGAWEDTVGEITGINEGKQCLTINVEMFGRETPVEIGFTDVKLM